MTIDNMNNNLASLSLLNVQNGVGPQLQQSFDRLASGLRINQAGDDAAGLQNASRLQSQISGLNQAFESTQIGINVANIADEGLSGVSDRLQRIRELVVQSGSETLDQQARESIQNEIEQNVNEISSIANNTQFASQNLLNGDFSSTENVSSGESSNQEQTNDISTANFQIGANAGESTRLAFGDVRPQSLGLGEGQNLTDIDVSEEGGVEEALQIVDEALSQVDDIRSQIGAFTNGLEATTNRLSVASENYMAAQSRIEDADIAAESTRQATNQMILQSNIMVQSQSNDLQNNMFIDLLR